MNAPIYEILVLLALCRIAYIVLYNYVVPFLDQRLAEVKAHRALQTAVEQDYLRERESIDLAQNNLRRYYDQQKSRIEQWSAISAEQSARAVDDAHERARFLRDQWYTRAHQIASHQSRRCLIKSALSDAQKELVDRYRNLEAAERYLTRILTDGNKE
jgi:hypothetical protein